MNFGAAIEYLKSGGGRIGRKGWNGKGMFVFLQKGSRPPIVSDFPLLNGVKKCLFDLGDRGTSTRMPALCLRAADTSIVTGWTASQTDILAEDWEIVE